MSSPISLLSLFLINLIIFIHLDSLERLQRHSTSLSSDDVIGLSHESSTHSQTSLLPRSASLPYEATPQSRSTPRSTSSRPKSPGSEMVTLEEFLEESNTLSPPTVRKHRGINAQQNGLFFKWLILFSFLFLLLTHYPASFSLLLLSL